MQPTFTSAGIGYDFVKTMNIKVLQGREFSKDLATDSLGFMLNEEALRLVGYKDPIGKPFTLWEMHGTIIGIVKDFNFNSLYKPISPLVMYLDQTKAKGSYILAKIEGAQTKKALEGLSNLYKNLNPDYPFTYQFSDAEYNKLYGSEQLVGKLANFFALLALFISCLGLLGLAIFTAEQRTKEVGIRKVLGANSTNLFWLLSKDFLFLVIMALVIASPIAWFAMNKWLENFAYRTQISWWMIAVAGAVATLISLLTISFQTIKLIVTNPINSIKAE
jgi:ABC-type antimicrobial peptide transport system permease subunit